MHGYAEAYIESHAGIYYEICRHTRGHIHGRVEGYRPTAVYLGIYIRVFNVISRVMPGVYVKACPGTYFDVYVYTRMYLGSYLRLCRGVRKGVSMNILRCLWIYKGVSRDREECTFWRIPRCKGACLEA